MKKIWIIPVLLLSIGLAGCSMFGNDGDDDDDNNTSAPFTIVGSWVRESPSYSDTDVYLFASDGTMTLYSDYAMTTVASVWTWALSGDTLAFDGDTPLQMTNISENEFIMGSSTYYRKGFEPDGHSESLPVGFWVMASPSYSDSEVTLFASDGTYTLYKDYAVANVSEKGTWSLSDDSLTVDASLTNATETITVVSENEFTWNGWTFYRKGTEPDGHNDLIGTWVPSFYSIPDTEVHQYKADGTFTYYSDYAMQKIYREGTWTWNSDHTVLTIVFTRYANGSQDSQVKFLSGNKIQYGAEYLYRKGSEPCGNVLSGSATTLAVDTAYTGEFTDLSAKLFCVTVEDGASYEISWDDSDEGSGSYTGDISVSAYKADKASKYFAEEDRGYSVPQSLSANGTVMYIVVVPYLEFYFSDSLGTYSLTVTKVTP
ncbi:lipocalin family protein [Sediminispirochaeta smaragdinae]|uniref:Lipocalin-like domain-containing protein n=1 Tax=Sediminispirochaeta smaragdinae (strain DSM 11293 / JCM 15392 / SEBR 4228) TaxID=573413 RepID=E1R6X6_SEDSS|nr:lipocalin family protein [Sediminispirochaeta smaragdinae]ADK81303.1 hypothetical protein Spirs_2183 [Sediminispirochaeta smaragdinae DSM 11293]